MRLTVQFTVNNLGIISPAQRVAFWYFSFYLVFQTSTSANHARRKKLHVQLSFGLPIFSTNLELRANFLHALFLIFNWACDSKQTNKNQKIFRNCFIASLSLSRYTMEVPRDHAKKCLATRFRTFLSNVCTSVNVSALIVHLSWILLCELSEE